MRWATYPYTGIRSTCKYSESSATKVKTASKSYTQVYHYASYMKDALQRNILSVVVDASSMEFQTYQTGIFNSSTCGEEPNHSTNIVGWGANDTTEYWIMRNSWGTSWGEQGYMKVEIVDDGMGICGIQSGYYYTPLYANV